MCLGRWWPGMKGLLLPSGGMVGMGGEARRERKRVAVLVSGGGTTLQALLNAQGEGRIAAGEIVTVISDNPRAYALERAKRAGVKSYVVERNKREVLEENILRILREEEIDLLVLAGFITILSPDFIAACTIPIINVHPSLIPSFCGRGFYGLKVHRAALDYGVKVTGATVHFVNEIPDGGEIIFQRAVEVKDDDTPESLGRRVMEEAEWVLLPLAVEKVCRELGEDGGTPGG